MSRKPSYPKDAAVGRTESGNDGPNANRTRNIVTGAAIGIGSAAIVAALLYAKKRKSDL